MNLNSISRADRLEQEAKVSEECDLLVRLLRENCAKYPEGSLGISPKLERLRLTYSIAKEAFDREACFDFVHIWPLMVTEEETFGGTSIIRPQVDILRDRQQAPRGVLISAGLSALDVMYDHGIDIGDIVNFVTPNAYRLTVAIYSGRDIPIYPMKVSQIVGSEDAHRRVLDGLQSVEVSYIEQRVTHRIARKDARHA